MPDPTPTPIRSTTQTHLDIEDITQDLLILKDGSAALVITTTALNFGLLSEQEQDATIYAYGSLLNSLTFPIQIVIRSSRKDVSSYLILLDRAYEKQTNPLLKKLMQNYRVFIQETVKEQNVLDKKFYIVIPFSSLELGIKSSISNLPSVLPSKTKRALPFPKEYILQKAQTALLPKKVHLIRLLARLGLKARQLTTQELIQLFFEIYNPDLSTGVRLAPSQEYESPLVQSSITLTPPSPNVKIRDLLTDTDQHADTNAPSTPPLSQATTSPGVVPSTPSPNFSPRVEVVTTQPV